MLIALLAALGVDLIVVVIFVAVILSRRRWVMRQPGSFRGAIRVSSGDVDGLGSKWTRGYGRWVRDILVWTKAPLLLRNQLVATDAVEEGRPARPDDVKRLGDQPVVVRLRVSEAVVEVATSRDSSDLLIQR